MDYCLSQQAFLTSYSFYQLSYGKQPILLLAVKKNLDLVVDLDDPNIWTQVLKDRAKHFQRAMPMAMENLAIAQHRDILRFIQMRSRAYKPQL
jgi:hypothetical protein